MASLRISKHAVERALDMGIEGDEIVGTITKPEYGYWSNKHQAWCAKRGRVAIGFRAEDHDPNSWVLLTVLWATEDAWEQDAAVAPLSTGRSLKKGWEK